MQQPHEGDKVPAIKLTQLRMDGADPNLSELKLLHSRHDCVLHQDYCQKQVASVC